MSPKCPSVAVTRAWQQAVSRAAWGPWLCVHTQDGRVPGHGGSSAGLPRHLWTQHDSCHIPSCLFSEIDQLVPKLRRCRGPGISRPTRGESVGELRGPDLAAHLREAVGVSGTGLTPDESPEYMRTIDFDQDSEAVPWGNSFLSKSRRSSSVATRKGPKLAVPARAPARNGSKT